MSSRQLKKLHKQQELLRLQNQLANDDEAGSEEDVAPPKPRASAFAGFAALGGDDEDEDEDEDEADEKEEEEGLAPGPAKPTPPPAKKNKKSKKKRKAKKVEAAPVDEIDLALKELSMKPTPQATSEQKTHADYDANLAQLLSISFDHLKVIKELRSMFGQDTIDSVRNQEEAQAREDRQRNRRRGPQHAHIDMETYLKGRPNEKIPEVVLRKNPFVQGKDFWPRASAGGLKMVAVTDERVEPTEYTFTHDKSYELLEMGFFNLVDMMDPMRIVHFIHENPYHVAGLVQTSRVAKQDHNAALASDLCERALFTFGRVTLSSFRKKLERGLARVDFKRPENRQFWLAGYHYIKSLMQKGTYNTALEWAKLYLSISPGDEYAMMNFIHVLAVYAYQEKWLLALCDSAYFNSDSYDMPMKEYYRQTCVLAKLQLGDKEGALKDVVKGMETMPWLYSAICSAVNIDTPRPIWGVHPGDDENALYTELYIHMAKDLWKRDAVPLLKEAGEIAQRVNVNFRPPGEMPLSIGRFIYLEGTPDLMGLVPPTMLHASPNFDYDPLPPPREQNIFTYEGQKYPWHRAENPQGFRDDRVHVEELLRDVRDAMRQEGTDRGFDDGPPLAPGTLEANYAEQAAEDEGGVLSWLAQRLLPVWLAGGDGDQEGPSDDVLEEMVRAVAEDAANPWTDFPTDTDTDGADDDDELPDLLPMGDTAGAQRVDAGHDHDEEEKEEEDGEEMPQLEPLEDENHH